jgi:2',3'-cyclic-nucleotide 2'-phosphodiesterase/3'-nucleotidase
MGCDLVVVLAHTGFERDLATGASIGTEIEDFAWRLTRIPGIDVLLTGHTHSNIPPRRINGVITSQPGARARYLTRIDLDLRKTLEGWRIVNWDGANLALADIAPDPHITQPAEELHSRVANALDAPIAEVSEPVSVAGCRLRDCTALDLIHNVQLEASGADLSLASLLTDRTPDLPEGQVTRRWVYSLYVYPNSLVKVAVTGAEVLDILEHAARYYNGLDCSGHNGCTLLTDPTIPHYNVDTMAGVSYRVDPTGPVGHRVRDVRINGRAIDTNHVFTLVCNNYRAAGGGGYPHLPEAEVVWQSSAEMTELIGDFIARQDAWQPNVDHNWHLGPALIAERPTAASP